MTTNDLPEWENPEVAGINREPAHATLLPYPDVTSALQNERTLRLLSGCSTAIGNFTGRPTPPPPRRIFTAKTMTTSAWGELAVPSNQEIQGYRHAALPVATAMPSTSTNLPHVPEDDNPVGCYRTHLSASPKTGASSQVFINFDGVDSAFYLWINGQMVGYSNDSRLPAEFNLTAYLHPGENLLAVRVYRWSSASYLEDQDMWFLSGIFRDVYLFATPHRAHARFLGAHRSWTQITRMPTLKRARQRAAITAQTVPPPARSKPRLYDAENQPVPGWAPPAAGAAGRRRRSGAGTDRQGQRTRANGRTNTPICIPCCSP